MEQKECRPKVRLLWRTPEPQKVIALAARMCYSSLDVSKLADNLEKDEIDRMVKHIMTVRHYSVLRHVVFMFSIEGVSRSFSHQFVRHHVGFDVEQRSQHYRREKQFDFNLPESVVDADKAEMGDGANMSAEDLYVNHMTASQEVYDELIKRGVDKSEARQVLPNACETQMVVTLNLNSAINVCSQRNCRLNTPEILEVTLQMRRMIIEAIPEAKDFLGPTCWTQGVCYEGEKKYMAQCRKPWQSPTVLWTDQFPAKVTFVGLNGGHHKWELAAEGELFKADKVEPSVVDQADQAKPGDKKVEG